MKSPHLTDLTSKTVLPRVWNRDVDIVRVKDSNFRGYVPVEALLCSQTIYGSARDYEVMQLRQEAAAILESGHKRFTKAMEMIREVQSMVKDVFLDVCS